MTQPGDLIIAAWEKLVNNGTIRFARTKTRREIFLDKAVRETTSAVMRKNILIIPHTRVAAHCFEDIRTRFHEIWNSQPRTSE